MAKGAIPILEGDNFYVPTFQVKVGERALDREVINDIVQVSYKDNIKSVDSFDITINNWDAEKREFKYVDSDKFNPGKKVELLMGYYGEHELNRMITGEITSLRPMFPASGAPTLVISGVNLLHKLRTKQATHVYEKLTDTQIAKQVAGRLGIDIDTKVTQEEKYKYIIQDNQYDIVFLMERARRIGYDLFIKEDSKKSLLYFGPSQSVKKTQYKFKYGVSLIQFQPTLTTANQVHKVTVRSWDSVNKKLIEASVERKGIDTQGVGQKAGQGKIDKSFKDREEVITDIPVASKAEAKKLAKETLEKISKGMIKGSGSTVGLPDLRAGSVVQIDGLGDRFSGHYFVTGTTHTIGGSGYTTSFQCRKEQL